jgi:hypothetical protein
LKAQKGTLATSCVCALRAMSSSTCVRVYVCCVCVVRLLYVHVNVCAFVVCEFVACAFVSSVFVLRAFVVCAFVLRVLVVCAFFVCAFVVCACEVRTCMCVTANHNVRAKGVPRTHTTPETGGQILLAMVQADKGRKSMLPSNTISLHILRTS